MIFQSELTNLDSELSQLQALLSAKQQQRNLYNQLQQQTEGYLVGLAKLKDQVAETVGGGAIASLKSAVLTLFDAGDSGNDGGNQPIEPTPDDGPAPGADDDEPSFMDEDSLEYPTLEGQFCDIGHDIDWYWERCAKPEGQAWEFASPICCLLWEDAPLKSQSCEWASPFSSPFASPLCSLLWEDAPLLGQHCTISPSATEDNRNKGTSEGEAMSYVQLVRHPENQAIAYQRKHDGEIICVYVGFRTKALASSWKQALEVLTSNVEMRQSKRLEGFKWELKAKGLSINHINRLATEDLDKSYRPEIGSAKPPYYKSQPKPEAVNPDEVQPGDIVTPLLTPGDSYEVLTVMPNGILDCKSLRTGVQMGMRPTAVSLVQKAQPTEKIEFNDLVEVIDDGNDCVGLVGSFGRVKIIGESRIGVEIDEQLVYLKPSELRIKAKEEKAPQRQALQSGQLLMGDRIITSGNYIGQGRISRLLSSQLGTADKIAAIELAKDLKNLGFDPRLAATVMAGEDDASDF
jgi:preprotein translocase subunit YajC